MKRLFQWLCALLPFTGRQQQPTVDPQPSRPTVTLEEQLETLAQLGLELNDGVTVDDLLYSCDRQEYENQPYDTLLFMLGSEVEREPWGRNVCDRAWNFDVECIEDTGSYVMIVENLCRVAGIPHLIADAEDFVDIENETAWLKYTVDGQPRHFEIPVDDDWADPKTISAVMRDIERDGKRFYDKDNGQASIWFYLDQPTADKLNALSGNALRANR
ncbi:MAG: hypothetical protein R3C99_19660 [Pirellulaceae bacterium]